MGLAVGLVDAVFWLLRELLVTDIVLFNIRSPLLFGRLGLFWCVLSCEFLLRLLRRNLGILAMSTPASVHFT